MQPELLLQALWVSWEKRDSCLTSSRAFHWGKAALLGLEKGQLHTHTAHGTDAQLLVPIALWLLGWHSAPASSNNRNGT